MSDVYKLCEVFDGNLSVMTYNSSITIPLLLFFSIHNKCQNHNVYIVHDIWILYNLQHHECYHLLSDFCYSSGEYMFKKYIYYL